MRGTMFALRFHRMFIRNDGLMTDNKAAAKLFDTIEECREYVKDWRVTSQVNDTNSAKVEVVEVAVKKVISKVGLVHEEL